MSEDTHGIDGYTGEDPFHPAKTFDLRPWLLDMIPATSLRKEIKINTVFKN